MYGADLTGAKLFGAFYDHATVWPEGVDPEYKGARLLPGSGGSGTRTNTAGADEQAPLSQGLTFDVEETLDEEAAALLWREIEPLRTQVENILQSEDLDPEFEKRLSGQYRRLQDELGETGGALGGVVRSYWLALQQTVAQQTNIKNNLKNSPGPAARYFTNLIDALETVAADPQDLDRLPGVVNSIEDVLVAGSPDIERLTVRRQLSDFLTNVNQDAGENRGLIGLSTLIGSAAAAAFTGLAEYSAAAGTGAGALIAILGSSLAMANRAWRIKHKLNEHPENV